MTVSADSLQIKKMPSKQSNGLVCAHCGQPAKSSIVSGSHFFCCHGCKAVFEMAQDLESCPMPNFDVQQGDLLWLDRGDVLKKFQTYRNGPLVTVSFFIPNMTCASCVAVLEQMYKRAPEITESRVQFIEKTLSVTFVKDRLALSKLVELLHRMGYPPDLNMAQGGTRASKKFENLVVLKLAVAGFCAGNIMLLSFPDYIGLQDDEFRSFFGWINLFLSLPALFFSGIDYLKAIVKAFRERILDLDVPIGIGLIATFVLSLYEILSQTGAGYFDSLTGLIFFLLIGKWIQSRAFSYLSFERDFTSYFPLSVGKMGQNGEERILSTEVQIGDILKVRHGEIIPCDGTVEEGTGQVDSSFITGESDLLGVRPGQQVLAGGKVVNGTLLIKAQSEMSRSKLISIWNNPIFSKQGRPGIKSFADKVALYFTPSVLILATAVAVFWYVVDPARSLYSFLSVLIVACPCTLALAYPVATGLAMDLWGKRGFFLKNADVIERLSKVKALLFDKTGTLTNHMGVKVTYAGEVLREEEREAVAAVLNHSLHPHSRAVLATLPYKSSIQTEAFTEHTGMGLEAEVAGMRILAGSARWITIPSDITIPEGPVVCLEINGTFKGIFSVQNLPHPFVPTMLKKLAQTFRLWLISGDHGQGQKYWRQLFDRLDGKSFFAQSPTEKLELVKDIQQQNNCQVCMIGDGLNDAGALRQAEVGIAVANHAHQFTPGSDAILLADQLENLPQYLQHSKMVLKVIRLCFFISLVYNVIGLTFAAQGHLEPLVAAILMPASSLTVVLVAWFGTRIQWARLGIKSQS